MPRLRFLHLSDYHARASRDKTPYRRDLVLGEPWLKILGDVGAIDYVLLTGDLADWGQAEEYTAFTAFLETTCDALGLGFDRVFPVPGNHDIDRETEKTAWRNLRSASKRMDADAFSKWVHPDKAGEPSKWLSAVQARKTHYHHWLAHQLGRPELLPQQHAHGSLGYRVTLPEEPPLHVIGLDTAWLCGDDEDHGNLQLTEDQVGQLTADAQGKPLPGLRLALMHHPLSELADAATTRKLLAQRVDLVLRGHLHKSEATVWQDPDSGLRQFAAGCLYEGSLENKWPNSFCVMDLDWDPHQCRGTHTFYKWSPDGNFWHRDNGLYQDADNGELHWALALKPKEDDGECLFDPSRPAVPPRFAGRKVELRRLHDAVARGQSLSLVGDRRIGKSSLLQTFAHNWPEPQHLRLLDGNSGECRNLSTLVQAITGHSCPDGAEDAADVLEAWVNRVRGEKGIPVILIDEFEGMATEIPLRFFQRMRSLLNRLVLIPATRGPIHELYEEHDLVSPFHNVMETLQLGLLAKGEVQELLKNAGFKGGNSQQAWLLEWAGRHPYFLNLLGRCLVDEGDQQAALRRFLPTATSRFKELWRHLGKRDKERLKKLAGHPCDHWSLQARGLVTEEGEAFGKALSQFLEDR